LELHDDRVPPVLYHCIWTLPENDGDYSVRWNLLKGHFSRNLADGERIFKSRQKCRERSLWQHRFWTHLIEDQEDYNRHVDYIHWDPLKHGHVKNVIDWLYPVFAVI
jgi:putative transposase